MSDTENTNGLSSALITALRRVLRPLVRLLIAKGVTLPQIIDLLKQTYVSVAEDEFPVNGKRQTDSRISVLTGVHRKDIKRIRESQDTPDIMAKPRGVSLGEAVLNQWVSRSDTTDSLGRPLALPRQSKDSMSFEQLVQEVSKDVRPRALLDEWNRLSVISVTEDDYVVLNRIALVPDSGEDEKAFYFGRNIADHVATTTYNLTTSEESGGNPLMERSVYYGGLTATSVKTLEKEAERLGMDALLTLNRLALDCVEKDTGSDDAVHRMSFGLYFFDSARTLGSLQAENRTNGDKS